jgi:hypothetical protein
MKVTLDISLTDTEAKKLYDIMTDDTHKRFVFKRYIEKKSMEKCAREMTYTERQMYRICNDVQNYALKVLLERLVASEVKA